MSATNTERSKIGHLIWVLAVPIVIGWFAVNVATNTLVPPLEKVGEEHTVGLSAQDAPSMVSMKRIGADFQEFGLACVNGPGRYQRYWVLHLAAPAVAPPRSSPDRSP